MGYCTVAQIRSETGIDDTEILTDNDILEDIGAADTIINNSTKHVWLDTDASYSLVKKVSKLLASSFSMDRLADPKEEGEKNFNKGMMLLQLLTSEDEQAGDVNIAVTEYKTNPLNPDAQTGRGRLTPNGIKSEDAVDPDAIYDQTF